MAEALDTERLKGLMECSVCLDEFDEPKMLLCGHQFCRRCLEDIVEFKADGSGAISCPLRCDVLTVIDVDQTINDLQTSYILKGMLDVLKTGEADPHIPKCTYQTSCTKFISTYCCETMMCHTCFVNHEKTVEHRRQHRSKVDLSYDKRENQLKVLCTEHCTRCSHLCIDSTFLCMYCIYRNEEHKGHAKNTVEVDVALLKEALVNESVKKESSTQFLRLTVENIQLIRKKLDILLESRIQECISLYSDLLHKEKEILKSKFEDICDNNIKQYPTDGLQGYNQEMLEKSDIVLAMEKDKILETISNVNKLSLICETVSFSEIFDFHSEHPLGKIVVTNAEEVPLSSPPIPTVKVGRVRAPPPRIIASRPSATPLSYVPPPPPPPGIIGIVGSASTPPPRIIASRPSAMALSSVPPPPPPPGIIGIVGSASAPPPRIIASRPSVTPLRNVPPPPPPPGIIGIVGSGRAPLPRVIASRPSATVISNVPSPPPPPPPGIVGIVGSRAPPPQIIASRPPDVRYPPGMFLGNEGNLMPTLLQICRSPGEEIATPVVANDPLIRAKPPSQVIPDRPEIVVGRGSHFNSAGILFDNAPTQECPICTLHFPCNLTETWKNEHVNSHFEQR